MLCPNCKKDYRDVPKGKAPGGFYRGDDHYYSAERRFGQRCGNCGFVAEMITRPTGSSYYKRPGLEILAFSRRASARGSKVARIKSRRPS